MEKDKKFQKKIHYEYFKEDDFPHLELKDFTDQPLFIIQSFVKHNIYKYMDVNDRIWYLKNLRAICASQKDLWIKRRSTTYNKLFEMIDFYIQICNNEKERIIAKIEAEKLLLGHDSEIIKKHLKQHDQLARSKETKKANKIIEDIKPIEDFIKNLASFEKSVERLIEFQYVKRKGNEVYWTKSIRLLSCLLESLDELDIIKFPQEKKEIYISFLNHFNKLSDAKEPERAMYDPKYNNRQEKDNLKRVVTF